MTVTYRCPRCQQTITLHITPKYPPTCGCRPRKPVIVMLATVGGNAA
jgi:hypothetical protein